MKDVTSLSSVGEDAPRLDDTVPPLAYVLGVVIILCLAPFVWSTIREALRSRRGRNRRNAREISDFLRAKNDPPA